MQHFPDNDRSYQKLQGKMKCKGNIMADTYWKIQHPKAQAIKRIITFFTKFSWVDFIVDRIADCRSKRNDTEISRNGLHYRHVPTVFK